jgi:hypothetical protein
MAFVPPVVMETCKFTVYHARHGMCREAASSLIISSTGLQMSMNVSPSQRSDGDAPFQHNHHMVALAISFLLALLVGIVNPRPLQEGVTCYHHGTESTTQLISKLEITPLGGGGFGGLGFGPGFVAPIPFGGFGFGFGIRNRPEPLLPPTEQRILEAKKQELQAVKDLERRLQTQIESLEKQALATTKK